MTRLVPVTVLVMLMAASGVASAQSSLPNGAMITFERRQIFDESKTDGSFTEPQASTTQLLHYFNLAHCNCARANVGKPNTIGTFNYLVHESPASGLHSGADFFAGTACDDSTHRPGNASQSCVQVDSVSDLDADLNANGGSYRNFNLYQVVNANLPASMMNGACQQLDNIGNSIYALVDTAGGKSYNVSFPQVAGALNGETGTASGIDTKPPPLPTKISAAGTDKGIRVSWTPPTSNATDIAYYQALCANLDSDSSPARAQPSDDPQFVTTTSLCSAGGDPTVDGTDLTNPGSGETTVSSVQGNFGALDKSYVCGQSPSGTATSLDISGLTNGTPYQVILVSADLHGNYTATFFTTTVTPVPSTDFWEDIHDRGSKTEGGLCLIAQTYGDDSPLTTALRGFRDDTLGGSRAGRWLTRAYYATLGKLGGYVQGSLVLRAVAGAALAPLVAVALAWHWLSLPGLLALAAGVLALPWRWRRRRRRAWLPRLPRLPRLGATAAAAGIVLAAGVAHAGGYEPYWENDPTADQNAGQPTAEAEDVHWHVGIRVGPYTPDIDNQFGMSPGPYQQMFGGARALPMLDVDRVLWAGFGQVAVGLSAGYMQKTAHTFAMNSSDQNPRPRAADTNTFRLIPFALTASYRFTWLDDEYGIPVVPYVKGGLAYYPWWLSVSSGGIAEACQGGSMAPPPCSTTKALGASLGVQGSIGLAIRAERIDAQTAMSMRQSGIQHAGIYGELSLAKVDGFGSDKKLSVGDRTWFAGVDFEF